MSDREVKIRISGQNVSDPAFAAARQNLAALGAEAGKAKSWGDLLSAGMSHAGKEASASSKMIAGMSQVGRQEMERLANATKPVPQQFSLATSAASLLKSTFGQFTAAGVAATVIMRIADGVTEFVATGNKLPAVQSSFGRLAVGVGQDSAAMLTSLRSATQGMVSNYDLMLSANKAMLLGLPVTAASMGELAKTATVLGRAMGQDATKSLDDLITALGRSSPLILDNLGLTVKVGEANEAYAEKLGKTASELTEAEKKTAFYQAAMEAARRKTQELGEQTRTATELMGVGWTKFGNVVSSAWASINTGLGDAFAKVFPEVDEFGVRVRKDVVLPVQQAGAAATAAAAALPPYTARLAEVKREAAGLSAEKRQQIIAAKALGVSVAELSAEFGVSEQALAMVTEQTKAATKETDKAAEAKRKAAEKEREFWQEASKTSAELQWMWARLQPMPPALDSMAASTQVLASRTLDLRMQMKGIDWNPMSQGISETVKEAEKAPGVFGAMKTSLKDLWSGMTGVDEDGKSKGLSGMFSNLGKGFVEGFGQMLSQGISGLINMGIGLAVKGIGKLGSAIKGLFGGGEHGKVNDMRDQFIAAAGGLHELNVRAVEAGTNLDALLRAKKVSDFEAAVASLNAKMGEFADEQAADSARLEEAIRKYGFAFEELGPKFQAQQLHERSTELIEDWRVLAASGIDVTNVNSRMADSINGYLQQALRVGAEVPAAMQPILQQMAEQGLLVDANGNKITDLGAAGITFSETMTQGFDRVVTKLQELIDRLQGAGQAITDIPRNIDVAVNVATPEIPTLTIPINYDYADFQPPEFHRGGMIERFHRGGHVVPFHRAAPVRAHGGRHVGGLASDEVPIIAQVGEGVLSRRGMANVGGPAALHALNNGAPASSGAPIVINLYVAQDPQGRIRLLDESARQQIQGWFKGGQITVPQRAISGAA